MQKIRAVIFDLDGTLADTLPLIIKAIKQALEPLLHRPLSEDEITATFGVSEEGTIGQLAPGHVKEGVEAFEKLYESLHDEIAPEPFPGIRELLSALKDDSVHIALVTAKGQRSNETSLKKFNLTEFFDAVETGDPSKHVKVEGIEKVLDGWPGVQKEEVIYVGDSASDIEASRKAGIPVVAACWAQTAHIEELKKLSPDELFTSVEEFAAWLKAVSDSSTLPVNPMQG